MFIGFVVGTVLMIPAMALAFISGGGGHGDYVLAGVLFPYTLLVPGLFGVPIPTALVVLAFAQFPIYGSLVGAFPARPEKKLSAIKIIVGLHLVAAAVWLGCGTCFR